MDGQFSELKALIQVHEEHRRAAERTKKEAEIIVHHLRAALSDLRELDRGGEPLAFHGEAAPAQSDRSAVESVEAGKEDEARTVSVPNGNSAREIASIPALVSSNGCNGGGGQSWMHRD